MNFNDFGASLVTLFHIMIVNNWYVTVDMITFDLGNNWVKVYFASFWVTVVLVMLNIVTSFVLEIYAGAAGEILAEERQAKYILTLKDKFHSMN